jgi:2,3-bisphosphoglycerate-dependent phosphoglycerate mutase
MLWLVRHAAVEIRLDARSDTWRLSEEGRAAAEELALRLPAVTRVLTSPEPKAVATAEPIARANGVELTVDEELREVERRSNLPTYEAHVAAVGRYLAGEPVGDWEPREHAARRIRAAVSALDDAVVVTHGTVLALLLGLDVDAWSAMRLPEVYEWTADAWTP